MRDDDFITLSRDVDQLRRLLVITWIADGKTRAQVEAFCDALLLPANAKVELLAMFDAGQPKPGEAAMVRVATGCGTHDARDAIRRAAGNVELAIEMTKKRGLA